MIAPGIASASGPSSNPVTQQYRNGQTRFVSPVRRALAKVTGRSIIEESNFKTVAVDSGTRPGTPPPTRPGPRQISSIRQRELEDEGGPRTPHVLANNRSDAQGDAPKQIKTTTVREVLGSTTPVWQHRTAVSERRHYGAPFVVVSEEKTNRDEHGNAVTTLKGTRLKVSPIINGDIVPRPFNGRPATISSYKAQGKAGERSTQSTEPPKTRPFPSSSSAP